MEKLAVALKQNVEEYAIAPFADGRFEVYVDDKRVHSKLESSDFPDEDTLVAKIKKMT